MRTLTSTILAFFMLTVSASAQTTVTNPTATKLQWTHDGVGLRGEPSPGFRIYITDQGSVQLGQVDVPFVDTVPNFEAPFPAMTPGLRNLYVTAFNAFTESTPSNIVSVRLVVITAPTNFKLAGVLRTPWGRKPGVALMLGYSTADGVWHPELRMVKIGLSAEKRRG